MNVVEGDKKYKISVQIRAEVSSRYQLRGGGGFLNILGKIWTLSLKKRSSYISKYFYKGNFENNGPLPGKIWKYSLKKGHFTFL